MRPHGDDELLNTLLQVPNRLVHGGYGAPDALRIAQTVFMQDVDPDLVKFEDERIAHDPETKLFTVRSKTTGGSESEGVTRTTGQTCTVQETQTDTVAEGKTEHTEHDGATNSRVSTGGTARATSDARMDTEGETLSKTTNWSETESQQFVTVHKARKEKTGRQFRSIDEQLFIFAQRLARAPVGLAQFARNGEAPRPCQVTYHPDLDYTDEQIEAFMEAVYTGRQRALYQIPEVVDQELEERETRLLEKSKPVVTRGISAEKRKAILSHRRRPPKAK